MTSLPRLVKRASWAGAAPHIDRSNWYEQHWLEAAEALGWSVEWKRRPFIELRCAGRCVRVREADAGLDLHTSTRLAGDKAITAFLFDKAGIPHPASTTIDVTQTKNLVSAIRGLGSRAVVKPAYGTGGGKGISVGPVGRQLIGRSILEAASSCRSISVQERVDGAVIRVLVLFGEVVDSVDRRPACVVGDGVSSVRELVSTENERRRSLGPLTTGHVPVGADHLAALMAQRLKPSTVPAAGRLIQVSGRSNTGSELESTRIELSESSRAMAVLAATSLGLNVAGIDLVINPDGSPAVVLEANSAPGLHWHVLVAGEPYDPFSGVLNAISARGPVRI